MNSENRSSVPRFSRKQLWILLAIVVLVPAGYFSVRTWAAGTKPDFHARFAVVDQGKLFRGSQPAPEDLDWVKKTHGLETIVVLRSQPGFTLGGSWWDEEQAWAKANGVEVQYFPCDADSPPTPEEIEQFLKLFANPSSLNKKAWPVLIHCEAGRHRTGVYAALYGMTYLGWSKEQALQDMHAHGFGSPNKRQKLVDVVQNFTPPATQPVGGKDEI